MDETRTARGDDTEGTEGPGGIIDAEATQPPVTYAQFHRGGSVDRFVILERVGAGGMGVVLAAYDPELDRRVALKILNPRISDSRAQLRLQREAQAMARLAHPNVVTIFDVGVVDDQVYVAMEFVDGSTLRQWLRLEQRSWRDVVEIFSSAGRGLAAAHAAGLVHRDFKPDNVLVGKDGRVRVADFGLASTSSRPLATPAPELRAELTSSDLLQGLTAQGTVLGTPAYMAPEQHDGLDVDERADQFAFCVALYEGLYGERPFAAGHYQALAEEVKQGRVREAPRGSKVPAWLRAVVVRGMRARPVERYPSMDALLRALKRDPAVARRRALGITGVVALAGLAVWGQLGARPASASTCSGARERMTGVWDPAARARVTSAMLATGKPHAAATVERTSAALDRYVDDWVTMHTDACRATRVRGEQSEQLLDLRMTCLERRRGQMSALVEVLAATDARMLNRAVRAATNLERLETCADADALRAAVPPPHDAAVLARVRDLDSRIDRLSALRTVGTYKPTIDEAKVVVADADTIAYAPLQARAHFLLGNLHYVLADTEPSKAQLLEAIRFAGEAHLDSLHARAQVVLAELLTGRAGQYEQGLMVARIAESTALRAGDELVTASARMAASWSLQHMSRYDEAEVAIRPALTVFERHAADAPNRLVLALTRAGIIAYHHGTYDDALAYHRRALDTAIAAYGDSHPGLWNQYIELGMVAASQGDLREGLRHDEKALQIVERSVGPDNPDVGVPLNNLAFGHAQRGDIDRAAELFERCLAIREKALGPDHPAVAGTVVNLADVRRRQGRVDEARAMLDRALATTVKTTGADTGPAAMAISYLGYVARQRGRVDEARAHAQRAIAIRAKVNGTSHDDYAETLVDLAQLEVDVGRCDDATRLLDQAQPIIDKLGADHFRRARLLVLRARCLLARGQAGEAAPLLDHAVSSMEKAGIVPRELGAPRSHLARALWASAPNRARREADRSESELVSAGPEHARALVELRTWRRTHR